MKEIKCCVCGTIQEYNPKLKVEFDKRPLKGWVTDTKDYCAKCWSVKK